MPKSRNCILSTEEGEFSMRPEALFVLGKAIISRIESSPVSRAINRSKPKAMPPWGGAPYSKASSRKPNLASASSFLSPASFLALASQGLALATDTFGLMILILILFFLDK